MKIESVGASSLTEIRLSDIHNIGMNMVVNVRVGPEGAFVRHPRTQDAEGIREASYAFSEASQDLSGSGNYALSALQNISMAAGKNLDVNADRDIAVSAGGDTTTTIRGMTTHSSGKDHMQLVGGSMRIEAHEGLHLRCGASELILKPDGTILLNGRSLGQAFTDDIKLTATRIDLN
ncbi:hypothetical protein H4P12_13755 [Paracoccus sp. 11-3]|uniref:Uncharacterized protein n=2 Tax=Paracoccus amoyensis TaxID=2760093 RepID=A0A926GGA2_9RHOB|nr:hypothetical protein [Paracoccus amoyensis]MBC9247742.1 hypothetical protein [Paracoccus amoyensis]